MNTLIASFRNFTIGNQILRSCLQSNIQRWHLLYFHSTPILSAEPLKKKRKVDPVLLKERAEKKIRRLQREIRKLEKVSKKYKPITEMELSRKVLRDSERMRPAEPLTEAEMIERADLKHLWAVQKRKEHIVELWAVQLIVNAQERAMDALQETSLELYEKALQPDPVMIPFKMKGPVDTPPIPNYNYPDGDYIDVTKQYDPIIPSDPEKQRRLGLLKKKK